MKIIACCKIVPEEQDIFVNADRTLNMDKAAPKISQYDLNAIEAAVRLAEEAGDSTVTALSAGGKKALENSKVRKDILSRGPDSLLLTAADALEGALPAATADALAAAATKAGFDLILCGEGSGDLYAQQTGLLLGEKLGVPCINAVNAITLEGNVVTVGRALEDEVEVLRMALPAVLCVTTDINVPKIPSMKAILAAGKKPIESAEAAAAAPISTFASLLAPPAANRLGVILEGDSDENIAALAEHVRKVVNS